MPTPATILALTLTPALIGTGLLYLLDAKPRHDPADDGADFDPRLGELGRRVGGVSSFHEQENTL